MVKKVIAGIVVVAIGFNGCSNSTTQISTIKLQNGRLQKIEIGYRNNRHYDGYYATIEKDLDSWKLKQISEKYLSRNKSNQEILYTNQNIDFIQPSFDNVRYYRGGTFECGAFADNKGYTPCNSNLMKINIGKSVAKNMIAAVLTLGLASGTHKSVDKNKITKIIKETDLIDYIRKAKKLQIKLQNYAKQIIVEPIIKDNSGFYNNEELIRITKHRTPILYPIRACLILAKTPV